MRLPWPTTRPRVYFNLGAGSASRAGLEEPALDRAQQRKTAQHRLLRRCGSSRTIRLHRDVLSHQVHP
jgi:hypothetical protein